jgi:hypothetical protein
MADVVSIVLTKRFKYRGNDEEFSNRYHVTGAPEADLSGYGGVVGDLITLEQSLYDSSVKFVRASAYEKDGDNAVWGIDFTQPPNVVQEGNMTFTGPPAPGDAAMTCRWWTGRTNSRGKKVYLRKYFHGVHTAVGDGDHVDALQLSKLAAMTQAALVPFGVAGRVLCDKDGVAPTLPAANPYVTTRTLKRRGKRPPS